MRPPPIAAALLLALCALMGCLDQSFSTVEGSGDGGKARIAVSPPLLDFGAMGVGDEPVVLSFTIASIGEDDLEVGGLELAGDDRYSFTLLNNQTAFVMPPGTDEVIDVIFEPVGNLENTASVIIRSNDADTPTAIVDLIGEGEVPELQITPDPLDMGTQPIGCEVSNTLSLENVGSDALTISELAYSGDRFALVDTNTLPLTLQVGDRTTVDITFSPEATDTVYGELSVTSTEPLGVRTAEQYGRGSTGGERTDTWDIPVDPPADLLFSLDQSCSMTWDIWELYNNFDAFVNELDSWTKDWQIIVANKDNGCMATKIITPSGDYTNDFYEALFSFGSGDYTEALLTINYNAVQATDSGECNFGFMRKDAMLHIIDISDEPEQSDRPWDELTQAIVDKKGSLALTKISAIAGDVPNGCDDASPGTGYAEAVAYTGGEFISICQNWATTTNLGLLAQATVTQDRFQLSSTPVESSIEVRVNGDLRSTWTYDSSSNAVIFDEKPPSEGDHIEISYESAGGGCD